MSLSISAVASVVFAVALLAALPTGGAGGAGQSRPTIGRIIRDDPALDRLLGSDAKIEVLESGFTWTEGPVWMRDGGDLLFSDIPGNSLMEWEEGGGVKRF